MIPFTHRSEPGFSGPRFSRESVRIVLAAALSLSAYVAAPQGIVLQVAAGSKHTCAVVMGGRVKCWGDNSYGQLGDGTNISRLAPVDVVGLSFPAVAVATGAHHSCALSTAGGLKCWGRNYTGQLGDGTDLSRGRGVDRNTPVEVVGLSSGVTAVAGGYNHTCALTTGGAVLCWGGNYEYQLGDGSRRDRSTPGPVLGRSSFVVAIAAGVSNSAAITRDGRVKYWGKDGWDMYCPPGPVCVPVDHYETVPKDASFLPGGITAVSVAASNDAFYSLYYNLCALAAGGRVLCWGGDLSDPGQLASRPELAALSAGVTALSIGGDHSCVLTSDGIVRCWDGWDSGSNPTAIPGLPPGVSGIAAGGQHTCVVTLVGETMCWGANSSGQLGDGTLTWRTNPVAALLGEYTRNYVQKAYVAYYGRPADPGGLDYWATRMDADGGSLDAIIGAFGYSDEFNRRYGGLSYADLVTKIYQQALGRDPDQGGLDWYVAELVAGRRTLQTITLDVLNGATTAPDSTVVANKLNVATHYTAKVAAGCAYGTETDGVNAIAGVTANPASVTGAMVGIDTRCGP